MFSSNTTQVSDGGYQISRSLRFNKDDTANLTRTPSTASNRRTWTWSGWVKRGLVDANNRTFFSSTNAQDYIQFKSDYTLTVSAFNGGSYVVSSTAVYRDPSAWYHIVVGFDSTQATASNRIKMYVNGSEITSFSANSYPTQNYDTDINNTVIQYIGTNQYNYFDGYITDVNFIDGQALTPSSFGETNAQTGVWQPKAYSGSYGTNGFYLNFSDNSNTTAATLGKDYSGNGNNWTPNNFSVTAGAGNDSLVDSPTSYGTDTGVGGTVRGNYCTWNPLSARTTTLTNGNLDGSTTSGMVAGTIGVSSGKWYWECTPTDTTAQQVFGIISVFNTSFPTYPGGSTDSYGYYGVSGNKYNNNASVAYGSTFGNNDVIGVALDLDAGTLTFYKNNTSQGTAFSSLSGTFAPAAGDGATNAWTGNFGQRPFAYTAPSGFKALCTQNLPTPTIGATSATLATSYFAPVIYTGNSATSSAGTTARTITGLSFTPDLIWVKSRNNNGTWNDHSLTDSVRGANLSISTNTTGAQVNVATGFTQGGVGIGASGGFTIVSGTAGGTTNLNDSSGTYVAWNWLANGSGSTNTAGTITSTVSASTTSGFSVVTYTGTGANATVGHGLGVAPKFIITKKRSSTSNWATNDPSQSNPWSGALLLNTSDAFVSSSAVWNDTAPTTTVFSIGTADATNVSSATYVAYCFAPVAGYSAFGSYTGNGSTDGPFVYCGFRPAFILYKRSSSAGNLWRMTDSTRSTYNLDNTAFLYPDTGDAENTYTNDALDMLSNGFKIKTTNDPSNASGSTYIFMAFAENPFKYSLAR